MEPFLFELDRSLPSLWVLEWKNPHPDKTVKSIDFVGSGKGVPILLGITVGQRK